MGENDLFFDKKRPFLGQKTPVFDEKIRINTYLLRNNTYKINENAHPNAHYEAKKAFFDEKNMQSLCKKCHSAKTNRQDGGFGNRTSEARAKQRAKYATFGNIWLCEES